MSNSPFDFNQLSTREEPLARRRRRKPWTSIAFGATGLIACAAAFLLLRRMADDGGPPVAAPPKAAPREPLPAVAVVPAPVLEPMADVIVDDDLPVICQARVKADGESSEVRYALSRPAPRGAHVDASSGEFQWRPRGAKPGDYKVTVQARRMGAKQPATTSFNIHVVSTQPPLERLLSELGDQKHAAEVLPEDFPSPYAQWLSAQPRVIRVGDEQVHAFVFETRQAADAAAEQIAPDLSKMADHKTSFHTAASCYRRGRLIALYAGKAKPLFDRLDEQLGAPIAQHAAPDPASLAAAGTAPASSAATPAMSEPTPSSASGDVTKDELDALVDLYQAKKLFVKKEYPTLRKLFAERFARDHQSEIAAVASGEKPPAWLNGPDDFKEELFTALDPAHDDIEAALHLVNGLEKAYPDKFGSYGELAIALAVTWDKPECIYDYGGHARRCQSKMPGDMLDAVGNFQYLLSAEEAMQGRVQFMPWEFLVLVVNHKTPAVERKWAVANYLLRRLMYGKCYSDVPYDDIMLETGSKTCRLGGHEYTLANIRQYGGVCAMQADFAARVGQSLGVPAAYVGGESNSGDLHAWVVWVELKSANKNGIGFSIESHGRYRDDKYYVGHLTDPRTGEPTTDRELELRLHSVGVNPQNQRHARLAMQAFPLLRDKLAMEVGEQIRYLASVTGLCAWNEDAWYALAEMSHSGQAGKAQSKALVSAVDRLFVTFAAFPDFTWKVFDSLIAFQQEARQRIKLYEKLVGLYELALRPDLACEARLKLSDYQAEADRQADAIEGLAFTIKKFPSEGRYVPRMLDKLEELTKGVKGADAKLVQFYQQFLPLVPQKRGDTPTKYCLEMYQRAIDRFTAAGQTGLAQTWSAQLTFLKAQKKY